MRRARAQALVETALVVPLLVLLAVGTIDIGRIVYARMGLSAAARDAARAATLAPLPARTDRSSDSEAERNAERIGETRGRDVARGFGLSTANIEVAANGFDRGSLVVARATDNVSFFGVRSVKLELKHEERVDRYRGQRT
jgi:Flp pilus assembly protein TadG